MAPTDEKPAFGGAGNAHDLVPLATAHIRSGKLPRCGSSSVLAGPGQNEGCALCGEAIRASSISYEISPPQDGGTHPLFFHIPCFNAWKQACDSGA